jgi:hypothetical protein
MANMWIVNTIMSTTLPEPCFGFTIILTLQKTFFVSCEESTIRVTSVRHVEHTLWLVWTSHQHMRCSLSTGLSFTIVWISVTSRQAIINLNVFAGPVWTSSPEMSRVHCERYPKYELERANLLKELREVVMYASSGTGRANPSTLYESWHNFQRSSLRMHPCRLLMLTNS